MRSPFLPIISFYLLRFYLCPFGGYGVGSRWVGVRESGGIWGSSLLIEWNGLYGSSPQLFRKSCVHIVRSFPGALTMISDRKPSCFRYMAEARSDISQCLGSPSISDGESRGEQRASLGKLVMTVIPNPAGSHSISTKGTEVESKEIKRDYW